MENLLNGKNLDEIEFQPNSTPVKISEEFHFGPNSVPLTPGKPLDQSEALSTKAVFGDESTASYLDDKNLTQFSETSVVQSVDEFQPVKEQDPMSASFYQEKDESAPFDLNKVQVLPDNLDDFLNKSSDVVNDNFNETISDLPQHSPLAGLGINPPNDQLLDTEVALNATPVTDLDKPSELELQQPEEEKLADFLGVDTAPKSPKPESESSFEHIASPVQNIEESRSPVLLDDFSEAKSPAPELLNLETASRQSESASPAPQSPFPGLEDTEEADACQRLQPTEVIMPEPVDENLCQVRSPNVISPEPIVETTEASDYLCQSSESKSPVPLEQPVSDIAKDAEFSPAVPEVASPEPPTEPLESKSPVEREEVFSPVQEEIAPVKDVTFENTITSEPTLQSNSLDFTHEISNAIQETVPPEAETYQFEMPKPSETEMIMSTPKSTVSDQVEIESVATTDVNSFLNRSEVPEVESPLNITEQTAQNSETMLVSDIVAPVAAAAAVGATVAAVAAVEKKALLKPKSATAIKRPAPKTAAPKPPAAKALPASKPAPIKSSTATKTTATKPLTAAKPSAAAPASKPRTTLTKAPVTEKKPLMNGEAKSAAAKTSLSARKTPDAKTTRPSPLANRSSLTSRSSTENKTASRLSADNKTSRPTTAPSKPAAPRSTAAPVPKPRPVPLSARTTASSAAKTNAPSAPKVSSVLFVFVVVHFCC